MAHIHLHVTEPKPHSVRLYPEGVSEFVRVVAGHKIIGEAKVVFEKTINIHSIRLHLTSEEFVSTDAYFDDEHVEHPYDRTIVLWGKPMENEVLHDDSPNGVCVLPSELKLPFELPIPQDTPPCFNFFSDYIKYKLFVKIHVVGKLHPDIESETIDVHVAPWLRIDRQLFTPEARSQPMLVKEEAKFFFDVEHHSLKILVATPREFYFEGEHVPLYVLLVNGSAKKTVTGIDVSLVGVRRTNGDAKADWFEIKLDHSVKMQAPIHVRPGETADLGPLDYQLPDTILNPTLVSRCIVFRYFLELHFHVSGIGSHRTRMPIEIINYTPRPQLPPPPKFHGTRELLAYNPQDHSVENGVPRLQIWQLAVHGGLRTSPRGVEIFVYPEVATTQLFAEVAEVLEKVEQKWKAELTLRRSHDTITIHSAKLAMNGAVHIRTIRPAPGIKKVIVHYEESKGESSVESSDENTHWRWLEFAEQLIAALKPYMVIEPLYPLRGLQDRVKYLRALKYDTAADKVEQSDLVKLLAEQTKADSIVVVEDNTDPAAQFAEALAETRHEREGEKEGILVNPTAAGSAGEPLQSVAAADADEVKKWREAWKKLSETVTAERLSPHLHQGTPAKPALELLAMWPRDN